MGNLQGVGEANTAFEGFVRRVVLTPPEWLLKFLDWICYALGRLQSALIPPPHRVLTKAYTFVDSVVFFHCIKLGVTEAIGNETADVDVLAAKLGVEPDALLRILLVSAQNGIFDVTQRDGTFCVRNNSESSVLHKDHYSGLKPMLEAHGDEVLPSFFHFDHAFNTSHLPDAPTAYVKWRGMEMWEYLNQNRESRERFSQGMKAVDNLGALACARDHKWGQYDRILDIGGSSGSFLATLLRQHANGRTRGVVCDLAQVIAGTRKLWEFEPELEDVRSRVEFAEIDFLQRDQLPAFRDGDCALMRLILHDWSDADALRILRNIRHAMGTKRAVLAIVEMSPLDSRRGPIAQAQHRSDLMMMVQKGKERRRGQWIALLAAAGFRFGKVFSDRSPFRIIIANPISGSEV